MTIEEGEKAFSPQLKEHWSDTLVKINACS